jgi:hypothetical protein
MSYVEQKPCTVSESGSNIIDAKNLKPYVKIEEEIGRVLELIGSGRFLRAREYSSFIVDTEEQRFYWNSKNISGDIFDWLRLWYGWDFLEAKRYVARQAGIDLAASGPQSLPRLVERCRRPRRRRLSPPPPAWRCKGREVTARAEAILWSTDGQAARDELKQRGLDEPIIKNARLGWNPQDHYDHPHDWGLHGGNQIYTPEGLVIPWTYQGQLWRLRVRRPDTALLDAHQTRYFGPRVYPHTRHRRDHDLLYNADALKPGLPAILVEGELDALSLIQETADLVAVVATGSVTGGRGQFWQARLAEASMVLVAFDADDAGDTNAQFWTETLPNAIRWRPLANDANQMLQDGLDLREWVQAGMREAEKSV